METNSSVYNKAKLLIQLKRNFKLSYSNYTMNIEKENGTKFKGAAEAKSIRFFALAKMLEKEVKQKPQLLEEIKNHKVQKWNQNYFYSLLFNSPIYSDEIYAVDITNAYPTVLFNSGLISEELFERINKAPKKDRLAAIGALASKKETVIFEKGKVVDNSKTEKDTSFIFNYCVKFVDYAINKMIDLTEHETFLFYWFDCLYFIEKPKEIKEINNFFKVNGLELHEKKIKEFEMKKDKQNMFISFLEYSNSKSKFERKQFIFPQKLRAQEIEILKRKLK